MNTIDDPHEHTRAEADEGNGTKMNHHDDEADAAAWNPAAASPSAASNPTAASATNPPVRSHKLKIPDRLPKDSVLQLAPSHVKEGHPAGVSMRSVAGRPSPSNPDPSSPSSSAGAALASTQHDHTRAPLVPVAMVCVGASKHPSPGHLGGSKFSLSQRVDLDGAVLSTPFELASGFQGRGKTKSNNNNSNNSSNTNGNKIIKQEKVSQVMQRDGNSPIAVCTLAPNADDASDSSGTTMCLSRRNGGEWMTQQLYGPAGQFAYTYKVIYGPAGSGAAGLRVYRPRPVCPVTGSVKCGCCERVNAYVVRQAIFVPDANGVWQLLRPEEEFDLPVLKPRSRKRKNPANNADKKQLQLPSAKRSKRARTIPAAAAAAAVVAPVDSDSEMESDHLDSDNDTAFESATHHSPVPLVRSHQRGESKLPSLPKLESRRGPRAGSLWVDSASAAAVTAAAASTPAAAAVATRRPPGVLRRFMPSAPVPEDPVPEDGKEEEFDKLAADTLDMLNSGSFAAAGDSAVHGLQAQQMTAQQQASLFGDWSDANWGNGDVHPMAMPSNSFSFPSFHRLTPSPLLFPAHLHSPLTPLPSPTAIAGNFSDDFYRPLRDN